MNWRDFAWLGVLQYWELLQHFFEITIFNFKLDLFLCVLLIVLVLIMILIIVIKYNHFFVEIPLLYNATLFFL